MRFLNAFSVIGRGLVIVAAACAVVGATLAGDARAALLVVALSLGITGLVFTFIGSRLGRVSWLDRALQATGVEGTARVLSVGETGVTVNGSPVLEFGLAVDATVHAPYEITIRQRAPRFAIGGFAPGATVGVRVDPADSEHLAIDWSTAPDTATAASKEVSSATEPAPEPTRRQGPVDAERLLRVGRKASAIVISMEDAGDMSELGLIEVGEPGDDDRLFVVDMEVKQAGLDPYEVRVAHRVPEHLVGRVGPRTRLDVAVDRIDDHAVAIDWDSVDR